MESSENSDTYLYGDSIRSEIVIFIPLAISSRVSMRGMVPFKISPIVERGTPVILDTWRMERFRSYIILSSSIFMLYIVTLMHMDSTGNFW